jgi:hypothetical protein
VNIFRHVAGWLQGKPYFHYACISNTGVCYAVVRLDVQLQHHGVIAVDELDASLIGQHWIRGQWIKRHPRHAACPLIQSGYCMNSDLLNLTWRVIYGEATSKQKQVCTQTGQGPRSHQARK